LTLILNFGQHCLFNSESHR